MDIYIEEAEGNLWAAAYDNGKLSGLEIDPLHEEVRWGAIFLARVKTIDAARDAAFVDLDGHHTGILYNKDVRFMDGDGGVHKGGALQIGKILDPGDVIIVQAKTAYIASNDDEYVMEHKIPEVSMDITLQGRFIVYCPLMQGNRLSSRISDKKLRKQITVMMEEMDGVEGCILRAAAAGTQSDILRREAHSLTAAWEQLIISLDDDETPRIIIDGPDAIQRVLSDNAAARIGHIEVTIMDHYRHCENWACIFAPDLVPKITPIELDDGAQDLALFYTRDIMEPIKSLFKPYVTLPSGGNLIIQHTAALTAIDINKGQDRNAHLATNLEAVAEAIRQIRLRNIGGTICIDCLKVKNKTEEKQILDLAKKIAALDACTVQVHGLSNAGLLELTRKRRTPPLGQRVNIQNL